MDAKASAKRTRRSPLLREALEELLEVVASKFAPSLYHRSADLCGMDHSRVGDLASYPKHFEESGS